MRRKKASLLKSKTQEEGGGGHTAETGVKNATLATLSTLANQTSGLAWARSEEVTVCRAFFLGAMRTAPTCLTL